MVEGYVDGACRSGQCSCAWVLRGSKTDCEGRRFLGPETHTNNYAEYQGLLDLLEFLYDESLRNVIIYSDSQLVVRQVTQIYETHDDELRPLMVKAYGLLTMGCHVLKHVKGHDGNPGNEEADRLCNLVLDEEARRGTILNPKTD
jgi:ribonuclease HI